jgi:hypothetical protein
VTSTFSLLSKITCRARSGRSSPSQAAASPAGSMIASARRSAPPSTRSPPRPPARSGDLVASLAEGPSPAAVRGIEAVAEQLAEQQVAVLLVAADLTQGADPGSSYRIGSRPTEFLIDDSGTGVEVPLEDGLVWAALHQDAIVLQLPDRTGPLAGEPAAALLRRGSAS